MKSNEILCEFLMYIFKNEFYTFELCLLDEVNWFVESKIVRNTGIPILFKCVHGVCKQTEDDSSLFNMAEAIAVVDQIKELISPEADHKKVEFSDIGVVTPYKMQCKIIGKLCNRLKFDGITIGTAEIFQGQEKPIMLLSTVRTGRTLGFVNSAQVSCCICEHKFYEIGFLGNFATESIKIIFCKYFRE